MCPRCRLFAESSECTFKGITVARTSIKAEASSCPWQQDEVVFLDFKKTNEPSLKYASVSELWQILSW